MDKLERINKDYINALGLDYDTLEDWRKETLLPLFKREFDNRKELWRKLYIILCDKAIKGKLTSNTIGVMKIKYPCIISQRKYYQIRNEVLKNIV